MDWFESGKISPCSMYNNISRFQWVSQNLENNRNLVLPKLLIMDCRTVKEVGKKNFCNRMQRWRNKETRVSIVDSFGFKNKKINKNELEVPRSYEVDGDFVRGLLDSDGSILQKKNYSY